jgi:Flp pilus assembly protein TadB
VTAIPIAATLAAVAAATLVGSLAARVVPAPPVGAIGHGRPGRPRRWLGRLGTSALARHLRRDRLGALVEASGARWSLDEMAGSKLLGAGLAVIGGWAIGAPLLIPLLGALAVRVPDMLLARLARRRIAAASREVPLFLDLLAVATSAGLAPQLAFRTAAAPLSGPLAQELDTAITRVDLGGRWRDELGIIADRLTLPDIRRAAAVLGRSESLGSSLADEVARLAADVRESRRARATERARTAPVKMLFPLVFLILPAFLLLTVVPVLLSTVRSIG